VKKLNGMGRRVLVGTGKRRKKSVQVSSKGWKERSKKTSARRKILHHGQRSGMWVSGDGAGERTAGMEKASVESFQRQLAFHSRNADATGRTAFNCRERLKLVEE